MIDTKTIWDTCLEKIQTQISQANFNTWFKNTFISREERGTVYLGVPNEFVKEWLNTKYHTIILRTLREDIEDIRSIEYIVAKPNSGNPADMARRHPSVGAELPFKHLYIDRKDNLNPRYQFENFIIGPFNEIAYSASKAIINKPGVYNPLFIYGSTGLGKTHLIQAVGNTLKKNNPNARIYYTSSENFTMELVSALRNNRINSFKDKYRKYDVLIMDDIQFLSGKDKTQEELFHLFNILYDKNKQIIFSSDKHPNYIIGLEERLKSRFSAGMIVDINKPEFESRVAILKDKVSEHHLVIENEIIDYVASHVEGNIRELEGILNSLIVQTQVKGRNLSLREVKSLIKNNIKPKKNVSIKDIVRIIADFYNIDESSIYEKTRRKEIVRSRQVVMFILREDYNISYPMIGKELGGRDHTTVIHSHTKVRKEIETDSGLAHDIEQLRAILVTT
jgi:chromosomal replication initiator protein